MRKPSLLTLVKVFTFSLIFTSTAIHAQSYEWTVGIGGSLADEGHAITSDAAGNVYVAGSFRDAVDFDPSANDATLTSNGNADVFIEKMDANGQLIWAKSFGGTASDYPQDIAVDANGNVYVIGYFKSTVDFDPNAGVTSISAHGASDVYIEKLDANGQLIWVKTMGGTSLDEGAAISIDEAGNIYTTGLFRNTVDFDPGAGTAELTSNGGKDVFVQKLDNNGDFIWATNIGGPSNEKAFEMDVDDAGNVYTIGYFAGTVDFDPGTSAVNRTSRGMNDIFVEKLDANGNFQWVNTIEGPESNTGSSVAVDAAGNVYAVGEFSGSVDFNPDPNMDMDVVATGGTDAFIQKVDANGELMWVKKIGGTSTDALHSVIVDAENNIMVTGSFSSAFNIDPTQSFQSAGLTDAFVAKYQADATFSSAVSFGGISTDFGQKIHMSSDGGVYTVGTFYNANVDFDPGIGLDEVTNKGGADAFVQKLQYCISADVPTFSTSATQICAGNELTFEIISGELNGATKWVWHAGDCTGEVIGEGPSITLNPTETTTYYVSGEGGCISAPICQSSTIEVMPTPTTTESATICQGESYTFPDGTVKDNITESFTYSSVFSAAAGCDSIVNTALTVNPAYDFSDSQEICMGESFTFGDGTVIDNITQTVTHTSVLSATTGCDSTVNMTVIPTILEANVKLNGQTLSTATDADSYQWFDCTTDMPIAGATHATFTPNYSGTFAVQITKNGCSTTSSCENVNIVGFTLTPAKEKQFDVYPNPFNLFVEIDLGMNYKEGSIALFHITGKQVYHQVLGGERHLKIDTQDLTSGVYYLQVIKDGIPSVGKVIK